MGDLAERRESGRQVGVLRIELEEEVPYSCARGGLVCVGGAELREQLAAAVDADLVEDGLQVVLHGVRRDEESFGDRARVEPRHEQRDNRTLALRERVGAAEEAERLGRARGPKADRDLALVVPL